MSRHNVVCSVPAAERHNCIATASYLHHVDGTPCGAGFLLGDRNESRELINA